MNVPRFLYHASAIGLAGEIRRPFQQVIEGQASCALSPHGGRASASAERYRLRDVLAHAGVATHVSGAWLEQSSAHQTAAQSTVAGFNLRGIVLADQLSSSVQSSHPGTADAEPAISIAGSQIQGLSIAGRAIQLESRLDLLNQLPTMTSLRDHYRDNAEFRDAFDAAACVGRGAEIPEDLWPFFPWRNWKRTGRLPEHNGVTMAPLFTVKNPSEPGFEVYGNVIKIYDFGKVQIGELIVETHRRRITMLHAVLGSPVEGFVTASYSDGNGSSGDPPPPPPGNGG